MRKRRLLPCAVLLAAILLLSGCAAVASKPRQQSADTGEPPLSLAKEHVVEYYESGGWNADMIRVRDEAQAFFTALPVARNKQAVVFDVDDTLLSNYSRLKTRDFAFPGPLSGDGDRRAFTAGLVTDFAKPLPVIKPMLDLYARVRSLGFALFLISERPEPMRAATRQNLYNAGFAGWTRLYLLPRADTNAPATMAERKRAARAMIEDEGVEIVATVGDQDSDLSGGHTGRTFKIPNRMYEVRQRFFA